MNHSCDVFAGVYLRRISKFSVIYSPMVCMISDGSQATVIIEILMGCQGRG